MLPDQMVRVVRFSCRFFLQRWQGIRLGIRTRALICSFMLLANGKGEFSGLKKGLQFRAVNE